MFSKLSVMSVRMPGRARTEKDSTSMYPPIEEREQRGTDPMGMLFVNYERKSLSI